MNLWIFVAADIFFALVAIYFSFRYEHENAKVKAQQKEIERRVFELQLIKSIADEIGYSLNLERVLEIIALTVQNVMELSTVSYAIIEPSKVVVKTFPKEPVSSAYFTEVATLIMGALTSLNPGLSTLPTDQEVSNNQAETGKNILESRPQSYFNVPIFLDKNLVGMIAISNSKKIKYDDLDMQLLFKLVETGQNTLQKLRDLIKSEEEKTEKVKSGFTDMMMHELRAPLTAIRGAADLMANGKLPPDEAAKMPHVILESSTDMLATVADFLDAAKMDEGKFKLNLTKSSLTKIIEDHLEVFRFAAEEKKIVITFNKQDEVPDFYFDQIRIGQVINNLVSNSIKFCNQDGKIDIAVRREDGNVEVLVSDNGVGIPDSKKAILFTKFGQIDNNLEKLHQANPSSGSSGLGLFISRQIIDAHHGKIWLESSENHGTVAHFTIPMIMDEKIAEAEDQPISMAN